MKLLKKFQSKAVLADFKTIEELNSTLSSWLDVEYDNKIHSSTGEPPNNRWRNNLNAHPPRRIKDRGYLLDSGNEWISYIYTALPPLLAPKRNDGFPRQVSMQSE